MRNRFPEPVASQAEYHRVAQAGGLPHPDRSTCPHQWGRPGWALMPPSAGFPGAGRWGSLRSGVRPAGGGVMGGSNAPLVLDPLCGPTQRCRSRRQTCAHSPWGSWPARATSQECLVDGSRACSGDRRPRSRARCLAEEGFQLQRHPCAVPAWAVPRMRAGACSDGAVSRRRRARAGKGRGESRTSADHRVVGRFRYRSRNAAVIVARFRMCSHA